MKTRFFAIALACAATFATAGELTDSSDRTFEKKINAHIDSQLAAGKVACDGLQKLDVASISMCDLLRDSREEKEIEASCKSKKLKGAAFKTCANPIRQKYRLRDE